MINIKLRKAITLERPSIELNSAFTCLRRLGIVFSPLRGLSTLSVLKALKLTTPLPGLKIYIPNSMSPEMTITKSRKFQALLR